MYIALLELLGLLLRDYCRLCSSAKCQFHHHVVTLILRLLAWGYLFFSALGQRPSAPYAGLGPEPPGPIKFISPGLDFSPVSVTKCACAT